MKPKAELFHFTVHGDERGSLIALEGSRDVPFEIKRIYYIYDNKCNTPRGFHAHHNLKQLIIAVSGSVTIICEFKGQYHKFILNSPNIGLLIEGLVWREMHDFSEDAVLLVIASEYYSEEDYIRDYNEFLQKPII